MWVAPVAVDISQLNWGCPLWSTLLHSGSRESKPQSITCYDHQDLLRQVRTWFKRKPKVKKCKSAFGKNYLGECVAQAKVDFWHFCSVSDCEDCDLCNNAGISLPVSPASTAAKDGMSMYCWVLFIQRRYANLCYQRSYDKRRLTEHLIVDLAFIFAALQRKGSGPHKRRAQEGDEENLSRSSHIINASSEI